MKLVEDPMLRLPNSNPFQHEDSTLKVGNEILKEDQNGVFCDLKGSEVEADTLPFEINEGDRHQGPPDHDCYMSVDNLEDNNGDVVGDFAALWTLSSSKAQLLEDTGFHTNKSGTECELPELVVCYKESYNHDVKDICVDEGVPSLDKFLVGSDKVEAMNLCTFFSADRDEHGKMTEEKADIALPVLDGFKSEENACNNDIHNQSDAKDYEDIDFNQEKDNSDVLFPDGLKYAAENACNKDNGNKHDAEDLIQRCEAKNDALDSMGSDIPEEKVVPEIVLLEQDSSRENLLSETSQIDGNEVEQQSVQMLSDEAISAKPTLDDFASGESNNRNSLVNETSYDSKVESTSITFHFDNSTGAASGSRAENSQNVEHKPIHETPNVLTPENEVFRHLTGSSRQVQQDHGEASFAAVEPFSGLITYSGPIAYSGSLSLRSDSSATSTRSFAFPVLQAEWDTSPVRMAKADRRLLRKHRGWRQGLLCCRF